MLQLQMISRFLAGDLGGRVILGAAYAFGN